MFLGLLEVVKTMLNNDISILIDWQTMYCCGHKMPISFRERASVYFEEIYDKLKMGDDTIQNFVGCNEVLYRVVSLNRYEDRRDLLIFDNLYYSFSNDIIGIESVVKKDRFLRNNVLIIQSLPNKPINYNRLMGDLFENYEDESRYCDENEIVSKCEYKDIVGLWFLRNSQNILNYESGIMIDKKDVNLSIKEVYKKYRLYNAKF